MAASISPAPRVGPKVHTPAPLSWPRRLAAFALFAVGRIFMSAWRVRFHDPQGVFREGQAPPLIFCLWHNRLSVCMTIWGYVRRRSKTTRLAALISASQDGGLLAKTLAYFGVTAVRGSTSRRGRQALLELARMIKAGHSVAITPDGPRGPGYQVQPGIISLAQVTGLPIMPLLVRIHYKRALKSWDQFQIPLPFTVVEVRFGPTLLIPRDADETARERLRVELQERMREFQDS